MVAERTWVICLAGGSEMTSQTVLHLTVIGVNCRAANLAGSMWADRERLLFQNGAIDSKQ